MNAASDLRPPRALGAAEERSAAARLNVDLHCHSDVSDGTLPPVEVVERAHAAGVQLLALTDHDEVGGLAAAAERAAALGLPFVDGVEISVTWAAETVHIVGLRIDRNDPALVAGLARIRVGRDDRAREIAAGLAAAGVTDALAGARRHARNPDLISRSHFARHLVDAGHGRSFQQVFDRYLAPGRPGFVPHCWARLDVAVALIRGAGGVAVLAHPGRYRLDDGETGLWALVEAFRDAGGEAIEVISSSHGAADRVRFARWSERLGLAASLGSDFHDPRESRVDLGASERLPARLCPIWAQWPECRAALRAGCANTR
jgi:predicted metal-dependent phosphoesterase TrpH